MPCKDCTVVCIEGLDDVQDSAAGDDSVAGLSYNRVPVLAGQISIDLLLSRLSSPCERCKSVLLYLSLRIHVPEP